MGFFMLDLNTQDTIEILYEVCDEFPTNAMKASDATSIYDGNFDFIYTLVNRRIRKLLFAMKLERQDIDKEFLLKELTKPIPLI